MNIYYNKPLFSIIIPCYNVSNFINRCINCLRKQSFQDFEIICVDDASEDDTLKILNKYEKSDSRISCHKQSHGGAGRARNEGYSYAQGEYVLFLDADDFFELNLLERLYKKIITDPVDIIFFGSDRFDSETQKFLNSDWTIRRDWIPKAQPFSYKDIKNSIFECFMWWGWDRAYKKSFIDEYKIIHQEITSTNDLYFNLTAFFYAGKIFVLDDILAHHTINNKSSISCNRFVNPENFLKALTNVRRFLSKENLLDAYGEQFASYCEKFSRWHLKSLSQSQFDQLWLTYEKYYAKELSLGSINNFNDFLSDTAN